LYRIEKRLGLIEADHFFGHEALTWRKSREIRHSNPACGWRSFPVRDASRPWRYSFDRTANIADKDLAPNALDARICSYECTFCADCVERKLFNVCPNCGGSFAPRPIRPAKEWRPGVSVAKQVPSDKRARLKYGLDDIAAHSARIRNVPPEER